MKTVKDYLDLGLVFASGDKCFKSGASGDEFHRHWHESPAMYSDKIASSFAWRENTGVKPEFVGQIEWVGDSDFLYVNRSDELIWSGKCIAKWRPSLNQHHKWPDNSRMDIIGQNGNDGLHYDNTAQQVGVIINNNTPFSIELAEKGGFSYELKAASSDNPIFTQAMACAGEFPLIGAKCVYVFMENGSEYTGSIAAIDGNVIWFKLDGGGYKTCFGVHKFKAVDNRTDREKAIDEMLELDLWATDREFLEAIYDAGYRKC